MNIQQAETPEDTLALKKTLEDTRAGEPEPIKMGGASLNGVASDTDIQLIFSAHREGARRLANEQMVPIAICEGPRDQSDVALDPYVTMPLAQVVEALASAAITRVVAIEIPEGAPVSSAAIHQQNLKSEINAAIDACLTAEEALALRRYFGLNRDDQQEVVLGTQETTAMRQEQSSSVSGKDDILSLLLEEDLSEGLNPDILRKLRKGPGKSK